MRFRLHVLPLLLCATVVPARAQTPPLQAADGHFQAQRWDDAERAYREILRADSTVSMAWYRLGRIALEARADAASAARYFEASLRHGFMPPFFARFGIARAYTLLQRPTSALAQLDTLAAGGFSPPEAVTGDSVLSRLTGQAAYAGIIDRMKRNGEPCEHSAEARQLDFWIGTWDVFAPNGNRLGQNVIEKMLRGCALLENWTDGMGRQGKSLNFYDASRRTWRQVWVADGGSPLDYTEGHFSDRAMRFAGATISARGDTVLQKLTFHDVHADTVRQVFESSTDRGKTWTTTWTGIYIRRPPAKR